MLRRFAAFAIAMVLPLCAIAAEPNTPSQQVIDDPLFRLEIPKDWKIEHREQPVGLRGPHAELMMIFVTVNRAEDPAMSRMMDNLVVTQIRSRLSTEVEGMTITEPLKETIWNGRPFMKIRARSEKDGTFVGSFGRAGEGGTMFIATVAGWLKDEVTAESTAESMLKAVVLKGR